MAYKQQDFSRRKLLQGIAGVGLSTALPGSLLLPSYAHGEQALTPRRGGRIRVVSLSSSAADTMDPAAGNLSTDYVRHFMFYSGLTQYDGDLAGQLSLAEALETDDQKRWHATLRKGVQFHDGKELTPADVVFSLMRHKDPVTGSRVKPLADQFESVVASGPHHVTITLKQANAELPEILADSHFLIVQDGTTDFRNAPGTGPYKLSEFIPGVRTVGRRNENFWKPGKPYLDEIELVGMADETARVNALLSGDAQLVNAIDPRSTRRIQQTTGVAVLETPSSLYTDLIIRQDLSPTSNRDLTLALKYLLDRDTMKRAIFRNFATIANDHPVHPNHPFYAADLPQRQYDPDKARYHLKKAGAEGLQLPVYASPAATGSVDMATLLQQSALSAGLNLRVNRVPSDAYWSNHWAKHPLTFGNVNPRPTLDMIFSMFYKSSADWNLSQWQNPTFDQLLASARSEGDLAKRKQMYIDMQELVHNDCGIGIPIFLSLMDGYDERLRGLSPIPIGGLMGYSFAEYVWLDS
jgi:peptide/nickel transport system substrate-binding protein